MVTNKMRGGLGKVGAGKTGAKRARLTLGRDLRVTGSRVRSASGGAGETSENPHCRSDASGA